MSEPSPLASILEPIALIAGTLYTGLSKIHWSWWWARLGSLFALPFRVLAVPLKILFGVLYVVFAPVIYVLAFLWSIVTGIVGVIVSLEVSLKCNLVLSCESKLLTAAQPLYTFVSSILLHLEVISSDQNSSALQPSSAFSQASSLPSPPPSSPPTSTYRTRRPLERNCPAADGTTSTNISRTAPIPNPHHRTHQTGSGSRRHLCGANQREDYYHRPFTRRMILRTRRYDQVVGLILFLC